MKACPFCGEAEDLSFGKSTPDKEGVPAFVFCGACGAQGPWSYADKQVFNQDDQTILQSVADLTAWDERAET